MQFTRQAFVSQACVITVKSSVEKTNASVWLFGNSTAHQHLKQTVNPSETK
jgi:hypothetical protein